MHALEASMRAYAGKKAGIVVTSNRDQFRFSRKSIRVLQSTLVGEWLWRQVCQKPPQRPPIKCMQEFVCACAGNPLKSNSHSTRCGYTTLMRILRSAKDGTYANTNQSTTMSFQLIVWKKLHWKSHRHIDRYTRDLVKQLRENNISLSKVYSVVGIFFGSVKEVSFTKRSLKNLCGKLNREQLENDATKTIEVFNAMWAEDPEFKYSV